VENLENHFEVRIYEMLTQERGEKEKITKSTINKLNIGLQEKGRLIRRH